MQPAAMQVEKVLEDLIQRLSKSDSTSEVRAALIEARRLRNVTMRWAAIPPPPDARREMLSRVMDLVQKAGPQAVGSLRPPAMSMPPEDPPPRSVRSSPSPQPRPRDAPSLEPRPAAELKFRSSETSPSPSTRPVERPRSSDLLDEVAPRHPVTGPRRPGSIPDRSAPPAAPSQPRSDRASLHDRSTTPAPAPVVSAARKAVSAPPPGPAADRFKQRQTNTLGYGAGEPPRGGLRIPSPNAPGASSKSPSISTLPSPSAPASNPAPAAKPSPPRAPAVPPSDSAPSPDPEFALPPPPKAPAAAAAKAFAAQNRTHTLAGIPEANEALVALAMRPSASAPPRATTPSPAEVARSSETKEAAKPRVATLAPGEAPPPVAPRSPSAPPPLRRPSRAGTLMMGGIAVAETLEALTKSTAPSDPPSSTDDLKTRGRPSISAQPNVTPPPPSARAPAGGVEGFSSAVSSPSVPAVRPSNPATGATQMMGTPPPSPATLTPRSMAAADKPLRTIVSPGVTIVRPDASTWQPHPTAAGVTLKLLYRDPRSGVYTALIRLAPGAKLPRRRHVAPEEALLVAGIALVGPHEMRPGEYCRAESETVHDPITTTTGCTFFVCGSEHDEFLEES